MNTVLSTTRPELTIVQPPLCVTLIRGLPGSGKSTLAKHLTHGYTMMGKPTQHFETDMFFVDDNDEYHFVKEKLPNAHTWCQETCKLHLRLGFSIIVSNTFTRLWEMKPYVEMAEEADAYLNVIECKQTFGSDHDVPDEVIENMRNRWEEYTCA